MSQPKESEQASLLFTNISENRWQVTENFFPTDRGLRHKSRLGGTSYLSYRGFGPALRHGLLELGPNDWWLDVGGGELFAQKEFFLDFAKIFQGKAGVVSVTDPETHDFQNHLSTLTQNFPERFFYLSGTRLEDRPLETLAKATLVSDLFGALTFSEHIDQTLEKELDLLAVGGQLITRLQKAYILDQEGHRFSLRRYLQSIQGAELVFYGWHSLVMKRKQEKITIPPLELVQFVSYKNAPNPRGLDPRFIFCERYYVLK